MSSICLKVKKKDPLKNNYIIFSSKKILYSSFNYRSYIKNTLGKDRIIKYRKV